MATTFKLYDYVKVNGKRVRIVGQEGGKFKVELMVFGKPQRGANGMGTVTPMHYEHQWVTANEIQAVPKHETYLQVVDATDWDLILVVNWGFIKHNLPEKVERKARRATWALQDGYGVAGYTPPQGRDWSGIRDSSSEAMANMGAKIRQILVDARITEIHCEWDEDVCWQPGKILEPAER